MKYIGKTVEYLTFGGITQIATIKSVEFNQDLGKPLFIGVSPWQHIVKFTRDEIHNIYR